MKPIALKKNYWQANALLSTFLVMCQTSVFSMELLELHDAGGPTNLKAIAHGIRTLSVVSPQGYTASVSFSGEIDGYVTTSGYFLDALCTDGPFRSAEDAIPGYVFMNGPDGVGYIDENTTATVFTTGQQAFLKSGANCNSTSVYEGGSYFRVQHNNHLITGLKDNFSPPLRLRLAEPVTTPCVFVDGFECSTK